MRRKGNFLSSLEAFGGLPVSFLLYSLVSWLAGSCTFFFSLCFFSPSLSYSLCLFCFCLSFSFCFFCFISFCSSPFFYSFFSPSSLSSVILLLFPNKNVYSVFPYFGNALKPLSFEFNTEKGKSETWYYCSFLVLQSQWHFTAIFQELSTVGKEQNRENGPTKRETHLIAFLLRNLQSWPMEEPSGTQQADMHISTQIYRYSYTDTCTYGASSTSLRGFEESITQKY